MTSRPPRIAKVERTTKESSISVELNLDGTGVTDISTGIAFQHRPTLCRQDGRGGIEVGDARHARRYDERLMRRPYRNL